MVACALLLTQAVSQPGGDHSVPDVIPSLGSFNIPLSFEANHGQVDERASFIARAGGSDLFLTEAGPLLTVASEDGLASVQMQLAGAAEGMQITPSGRLPGNVNYFIGSDPAGWHTDIPTYARVTYEQVYLGVDLAVYGAGRTVEYDFIVAPGAEPSVIAMEFTGAESIALGDDGRLVLTVANGQVVQQPPVIYQVIGGERVPVDGGYAIEGEQVGFSLGAYDASRELVIDPVLQWGSFLGGTNRDEAFGVAVDGEGDVYVTGSTNSDDFPTTPGAFDETYDGETNVSNAFVTKISADGTTNLYTTFLGGNGNDTAFDIEVNDLGQAVVGGLGGGNFPGAGNGGFIAKLSDDGSALEYSITFGANTQVYGLELNDDDEVAFAGFSLQAAFPATGGSFQPALNGNGDAIVGILAADGSGLVWGSYLGGTDREFGYDVALDGDGYVYVTGDTPSEDFPTVNAEDATLAGQHDAFVAKIMPDGSSLMYSTYLGGEGGGLSDQGYGIAADDNGNAYVTGYTNASTDFPLTNGSFQHTYGGNTDAFVTKYDADGDMVYSTFLGGQNVDRGSAIEVDEDGNAYVAGSTSSINFPTVDPLMGDMDSTDVYVAVLNASGSALEFSTYIAGDGNEEIDIDGNGIALDSDNNIYLVGITDSADFPVTNGAFKTVISAAVGAQGGSVTNDDAFVVKLLAEGNFWGDVDCSGGVNVLDARKLVLAALGQPASQPNDCPDISDNVTVDGTARIWGDVDCSGGANVLDARKLVLAALGQPASQPSNCPDIGDLIELS